MSARRCFDVVGALDTNRNGEIKLGEVTSGGAGSLADRVGEHVRGLGEERVADPPIGEFAGEAQVCRAERSDIDRDMRRWHRRSDRATLAIGERKLIDVALVGEAFTCGDRPDDLDRFTGASHGPVERTPCQPSITCGPLAPRPSTNLPSDSACNDIADMASIAGMRAPSCTIPVPSRIVWVWAARYASGVSASAAQNSGTHTESTPIRSA